MVERTAIIKNKQGIHCRPSAVIIKASEGYAGTIRVCLDSRECSPTSILDLISLGLECGTEIRIRVEGPDEHVVCGRMVDLFETHFDFPPR